MATAVVETDISHDELHCVLCCEDIDYSACGSCDHPICLKCCVKLRLLRKEYECPVCRAKLEMVVVSKGYKSWADKTSKPRHHQHVRNHGIFHESQESQAKVDELLEHRCTECNATFRSFPQVKDHVRKAHSMMFCDICLRHLKIFTHERKCYTREDLVRHRKEGDMDDRSHRGHPLCEFCDDRYLDNDDLLTHLRKHHFWCHICEKDGNQDYYPNYNELRRHFKKAHFLCEDGECLEEKFTNVFRLKVDFQAHVAQKHSNKLTKAEARQMRQLDVNITFARREDPYGVVSARDYNFPEQGHERNKERSKMTSSSKEKDRKRETQQTRDVTSNMDSQRYRQTNMGMRGEGSRGAERSKMRSPRDLLEGDHKRPPGTMGDAETNDKRIFHGNDKIRDTDNPGKKSGKSGKIDADDAKARKNKSKKKELSDEGLVNTKGNQNSLDENGLSSQEKKNYSSSSKTKNQESNESSSDQKKADKKSKSKNNNDLPLAEKPKDVPQEKDNRPSSSVALSAPNMEDDFPALSGDKKQGAPVNVVKPKPTYDSEFPSLANEPSKPSIRPPPGLVPPPGFNGIMVEPKPNQTNLMEAKIEPQKPGKSSAKKASSKSSVPGNPAPRPTYDTEFPTLSNGRKANSGIKAPPGFQAKIPTRPPPGMGWSASSVKETRSQKLLNDIRRILNLRNESFERFREISGFYRQGKSSPEEYYQECCSLLGKENIHKVFHELIDLLPDEEKQRKLLVVYNDAKVKEKLEGSFKTKETVDYFNMERVDPPEMDRIENGLVSPPSLVDDFPELSKTSGKKSKSAGKVSNVWSHGK